MSTTFEATSPVRSTSTMASASAVSPASTTFVGPSFHNLANHVILSPPNREDVNLSLSPSSSFLTNFSSVCNGSTSKTALTPTFSTSFAFRNDKENTTCPATVSNGTSNGKLTDSEVKDNAPETEKENGGLSRRHSLGSCTESTPETVKSAADGSKETFFVLDENSSTSNSTQSSENTNGSTRKKRRRGEGQLLMEDLVGINKSLADDIANHLKTPTKSFASEANPDTKDLSGTQAEDDPKEAKSDSPAFRLRPRRSVNLSGSGSSSPVSLLFSPIKRSKQPLLRKSINIYTQQLLTDTSKQLSQFLDRQGPSGHTDMASNHSSSFDSKDFKDDTEFAAICESLKPHRRSYEKSILRDIDVSVFAEMITLPELSSFSVYSTNYLALQIVDIKPLRVVELLHPQSKEKLTSPLLELTGIDILDRFSLPHAREAFGPAATSSSQLPAKHLIVYLLGTYATKASELASIGQVVNIVKFRTTQQVTNSEAMQPPKKRKLNSPLSKGIPSEGDNGEHFPFRLIVDSLTDIIAVSNQKMELKEELPDTEKQLMMPLSSEHRSSDVSIEELFNNAPYTGLACEPNWVPLVSFSEKWRAPEDPKDLNRTLHVIQPSIPKFESASRTVKMNT